MSLPKNGNNIIVPREGQISPYIESLPQPHVNYVEEDLSVYSIFLEEYNAFILPSSEHEDGMWHMHFDGACSSEGNGAGIILYSPVGKTHNFSYRLEFACTNNITKFEALILGIENYFNIGCYHLIVFWDSELIVNMVRIIYTPSNNLLKKYTHAVWYLISNFLYFNNTHIGRDLNSMDDMLAIFATIPSRQLLP
jgi:ribonuclease HI